MRKYKRDLLALIAKHGAEILRTTGSGHYMIRRKDGASVCASSTPSDRRALRNIEGLLSRGVTT